MDLSKIISLTDKPKLYEKGTAFMWTDEHISKQLLQVHLDPDVDLASRKKSTIEKTAEWILEAHPSSEKLNILDLGCGPGLYAETFAKSGHDVTGIDISRNSIDYAVQSANKAGVQIKYQNANYLDIDFEQEKYDLIVLIYADLGVLLPLERDALLAKIHGALKEGGVFIFDVLKDGELTEKMSPKTWEASSSGFWKDGPYLALSAPFLYEEEKVILFQHTIIDGHEDLQTYRFWTHFFSRNDLTTMLERHHFSNFEFRDDILPEGDMWNGDNVIFTRCEK